MGIRCSLTHCSRLVGTAVLLVCACRSYGADACDPADIHGPYGFQMAGTTMLPGKETPIAVVGRLVLDGKDALSGVISVNFNGLFLGNPTTGTYEVKEDCTMTFSLQDTSGGFQHFTGHAETGGDRMEVVQSDPDTHERGSMMRSLDSCNTAAFQGKFNFTMLGHSTPYGTEGARGAGSAKGIVQADGAGNLLVQRGDAKTSGTYTVDSDCFVQLDFGIADGDSSALVKLRGILVNGGKEVLAVESDPEQVASAHFAQ